MTADGDRPDLVAQGREALADLERQHDAAVAGVVAAIQNATGVRLVHGRPNVLDANYGELAHMAAQTRAYLAAWQIVGRWLPQGSTRRLGDLLKVVPPDVAEEVTSHLRAAGLLRE